MTKGITSVIRKKTQTQRRAFVLMAVMVMVTGAGCGDDASGPGVTETFTVEVSGEHFKVQVIGAANIAAFEERLQTGIRGVINGELRAGDGGFNSPWSWHLEPETVHTADISIELCDGRPSLVEADTAYWLSSVKRFCPWGAKVVSTSD